MIFMDGSQTTKLRYSCCVFAFNALLSSTITMALLKYCFCCLLDLMDFCLLRKSSVILEANKLGTRSTQTKTRSMLPAMLERMVWWHSLTL